MSFPNLKNKHLEDSMFTPKDFMAYQKTRGKFPTFNVPYGVILCYSKSLMDSIAESIGATTVDSFHGEMILFKKDGKEIAVLGNFGIGAPVAVATLEELIAFGVKKFISIGMAGSLQKDIKIGDLMICDRAIRDEGTSYHYLKSSKYAYASKKLVKKIEKLFRLRKLQYFKGTSWTIDAPYRETVAEARKYQKEGVATVEMEAAALFSVAQFRKVELGAIFAISDSLADLEWKPSFHQGKTKDGLKAIFEIAIGALIGD